MRNATLSMPSHRLVLRGETAADLMTPNPLSIRDTATLKEAVAFLTDRGFSAAPVVDDAGRPVGVLSQTDIVIHDRNQVSYLPTVAEYYDELALSACSREKVPNGFLIENVDRTMVREIMTPTVIAVTPTDTVARVVGEMVAFKIHRLFVVDEAGVLVGVISATDILRNLRGERVAGEEMP